MELHGGIFERELVYDHTDYLIVRNTMSEKYKTAIEGKKVIIVNEYWVEDSTRCGSHIPTRSSSIELLNPFDYQNYTQPQSILPSQDKGALMAVASAKESSTPTTFTDSCLSMIQPLEKGASPPPLSRVEYLTPNKTVARTRGCSGSPVSRIEVDLLLDGYIFFLAIADKACYKRVMSILCSHGAFWSYCLLSLTP